MANYVYSVKTIKYGTPTGTATMPVTLTALPDTVKGSINIDETEGSSQKFFTDQKKLPVKVVKMEEGEMTAVMQFYDMSYAELAQFKGGHGSASGYTASTDYTQIEKALEFTLDSGHKLNMFNAQCISRITGGGGRDKMLAWELKATPQTTTDTLGSWELKPV